MPRLPLGLVGMVALLILCESCLARHALDLMHDVPFSWRWGAEMATREAPRSEILCFGDSLVKCGVAPRVVADRTGRTMWNLAVTGGRPACSYFLLRRALDAGARPVALVIDGDLLYANPFEMPYLWPQLATPLEAIEMAWVGKNPRFFARYGLAWLLPSVRGRYEIRTTLLAAVQGQTTRLRSDSELADRNWMANRGTSIAPPSVQLSSLAAQPFDASPAAVPVPGHWSCHPVNRIYLDKFLDLAASRGIPVFWVFPPHYRMLEAYFDRPNWSGLQRRFVRERVDRYPNLVVIDGLHANYDRTVVMDVSHLNQRGAVAYSIALGNVLLDRLAAGSLRSSRWIELPAFAEPPPEAPVENMAQSTAALAIKR